jgi:hypothetical protein
MTKKRHPSSRTTPAMRRQIQESSESNRSLARQFGVNRKTIAKWRGRSTVAEAPMGPKPALSSVLSKAEETLIVVYRKYTRLPINDCLRRLKSMIPKLTRSSLHQCLKQYAVHRLPKGYGQKHPPPERGEWPHFTIQIHLLDGKYLYSAINNSMFVFAAPSNTFDEYQAARFMTELRRNAPVRVQSVATSDHPVFSDSAEAPWASEDPGRDEHPFLRECRKHQITRHSEGPRSSTPGLVVKGWGQILRRRIANRRFEPLSLADKRRQRCDSKERKELYDDREEGDFFDDPLSPEALTKRRKIKAARLLASRRAAAESEWKSDSSMAAATRMEDEPPFDEAAFAEWFWEQEKDLRRRPERRKRREARIAKRKQRLSPGSARTINRIANPPTGCRRARDNRTLTAPTSQMKDVPLKTDFAEGPIEQNQES